MILTPKDHAARKVLFQKMGAKDKAVYILTYYKLPLLLGLAVLTFISYTLYRHITDKDAILYAAYINVSVGEDLDTRLNEQFISASGENPHKTEICLYNGLYLSDSPSQESQQYSYASRLKVLASIQDQKLDVVLMNKDVYDIISHEGYLLELPDFLSDNAGLYDALKPHLSINTVILKDNAIEYELREADQYEAVTKESTNAIEVSQLPMFSEAGFSDKVYLGVIANSPRLASVLQYIQYLTLEGTSAL